MCLSRYVKGSLIATEWFGPAVSFSILGIHLQEAAVSAFRDSRSGVKVKSVTLLISVSDEL